jgi:PRC-barrel domain
MTALKKLIYTVLFTSFGAGSILVASAADEYLAQSDTLPHSKMTVLRRTESVLGKTLICASGENAGRIVDVLADPTGQVRAAVIDFGGFLGVGSRKIAVEWSDLRFVDSRITIDLTRDRLSRAPEVKEGRAVIAISARPARDRADAYDQLGPP